MKNENIELKHCEICGKFGTFYSAGYTGWKINQHRCGDQFMVVDADEFEGGIKQGESVDDLLSADIWEVVFADDPQTAAEEYLDRNYSDWDCPDDAEFVVVDDKDVVRHFKVSVSHMPCFEGSETDGWLETLRAALEASDE